MSETPEFPEYTASDYAAKDAYQEDMQRRHDAPKQKQSTKKMLRKARDARAMEMRMSDATFPEIMEECGYPSVYAVRKAIDRAVNKAFDTNAEAMRIVEDNNLEVATRVVMDMIRADKPLPGLDQLEELLSTADRADVERAVERMVETASEDADRRLRAVDRIITIGARKGKLWGYDAPTKQEISGDAGIINVVFDAGVSAASGMDEPELVVEPKN